MIELYPGIYKELSRVDKLREKQRRAVILADERRGTSGTGRSGRISPSNLPASPDAMPGALDALANDRVMEVPSPEKQPAPAKKHGSGVWRGGGSRKGHTFMRPITSVRDDSYEDDEEENGGEGDGGTDAEGASSSTPVTPVTVASEGDGGTAAPAPTTPLPPPAISQPGGRSPLRVQVSFKQERTSDFGEVEEMADGGTRPPPVSTDGDGDDADDQPRLSLSQPGTLAALRAQAGSFQERRSSDTKDPGEVDDALMPRLSNAAPVVTSAKDPRIKVQRASRRSTLFGSARRSISELLSSSEREWEGEKAPTPGHQRRLSRGMSNYAEAVFNADQADQKPVVSTGDVDSWDAPERGSAGSDVSSAELGASRTSTEGEGEASCASPETSATLGVLKAKKKLKAKPGQYASRYASNIQHSQQVRAREEQLCRELWLVHPQWRWKWRWDIIVAARTWNRVAHTAPCLTPRSSAPFSHQVGHHRRRAHPLLVRDHPAAHRLRRADDAASNQREYQQDGRLSHPSTSHRCPRCRRSSPKIRRGGSTSPSTAASWSTSYCGSAPGIRRSPTY